MTRYDAHVHSTHEMLDPELLLHRLEEAGFYGCCVFSNQPKEMSEEGGSDFEDRLETVLACTNAYPDRLFPVLWIHPFEENILEKVKIAADRGICAFKIICNNFIVSDEKCMEVLRSIAALDKPVFFHSGVLWDANRSSANNRPMNWEALIDIEGLRFSMGHCSWPWIDECIALYGKLCNSYVTRKSAEMFFDLTPGTPENYRRELLEKLFLTGYDVGENILFGTDSTANTYASAWGAKWLKTDCAIMDDLGISKAVRQQLYHDNLLRFLGKQPRKAPVRSPVPDDSNTWLPYADAVPGIIEKWYRKLGFPSELDRQFCKALATVRISDDINIDRYDLSCSDGVRNVLSSLYMCESVSQLYNQRNIPEEVMLDTLYDIVRWTIVWTNLKGTLYNNSMGWLKYHLSGILFKLGRLQFAMGHAEHDIPERNVGKGDPIMEIHIPEDGPLTPEAVEESLNMARDFFATYFPEYHYDYFTCHSWLLDPTLKDILPENSNILAFQNRFTIVDRCESYALLRYIFRWNTTRLNLQYSQPASGFAAKVKAQVAAGTKFYEAFGYIAR